MYQTSNRGGADVFITKFSSAGTVVWSTYVGGTENDVAQGVAVDSTGAAFVTGYTSSSNFPVKNAFQTTYGGAPEDAFAFKISADGTTQLIYSTYLDGNDDDEGTAIAIDALGNAYVVGRTKSTNFPLMQPTASSLHGGYDTFLSELAPTGSSLVFSTYFGGFKMIEPMLCPSTALWEHSGRTHWFA